MNLQENILRIKEVMGLILENDDEIINCLNENKFILKESVEGIENVIGEIVNRFPDFQEFSDKLKQFIENSGCQKIELAKFKYPASGAALMDGVLINKNVLNYDLGVILYVIFHEIAHQYQFKKYGADTLYRIYSDDMDIIEAAKYMNNIELVADEFAARKVREFVNIGALDKNFVSPQTYKNVPIEKLASIIFDFRKRLKNKYPKGSVSKEQISELFYNMVKSKGGILGFFGL